MRSKQIPLNHACARNYKDLLMKYQFIDVLKNCKRARLTKKENVIFTILLVKRKH
jgi:hypothetical protein